MPTGLQPVPFGHSGTDPGIGQSSARWPPCRTRSHDGLMRDSHGEIHGGEIHGGEIHGGEIHGGDGPAVARRLGWDPSKLLHLSQSLNPEAPDVRAIVARHLDTIGHYPDPSAATSALAEAIGVDPAE